MIVKTDYLPNYDSMASVNNHTCAALILYIISLGRVRKLGGEILSSNSCCGGERQLKEDTGQDR